jgi:hypothetical protein
MSEGTNILNKPTGWVPDPEGVEEIIRDPSIMVRDLTKGQMSDLRATLGKASRDAKRRVMLTDALRVLEPGWKRGAQKIGDCVSWGWEIAGTLSVAHDIVTKARPITWPGVMATESLYGLMRVEALGKRRGGYQDGAYGAAAAKAATTYGFLARQDYSQETGNTDHDLRQYNGQRAKEWGNFGNGGERDAGKLDEVAKRFPSSECPRITTFEDAAASIEQGWPVAVCSDVGFNGARDRNGFKSPRGTWYHCMAFFAVRWDRPGLGCMQSWGNSEGLENADPADVWPELAKCFWWVTPETANRMLSQGDSYAVTGIEGFKLREIDWLKGWDVVA